MKVAPQLPHTHLLCLQLLIDFVLHQDLALHHIYQAQQQQQRQRLPGDGRSSAHSITNGQTSTDGQTYTPSQADNRVHVSNTSRVNMEQLASSSTGSSSTGSDYMQHGSYAGSAVMYQHGQHKQQQQQQDCVPLPGLLSPASAAAATNAAAAGLAVRQSPAGSSTLHSFIADGECSYVTWLLQNATAEQLHKVLTWQVEDWADYWRSLFPRLTSLLELASREAADAAAVAPCGVTLACNQGCRCGAGACPHSSLTAPKVATAAAATPASPAAAVGPSMQKLEQVVDEAETLIFLGDIHNHLPMFQSVVRTPETGQLGTASPTAQAKGGTQDGADTWPGMIGGLQGPSRHKGITLLQQPKSVRC